MAAILLPVGFPASAGGQRVLGVGDDALVLPRGVFRFRTLSQWTTFNERYGMNTPGRPDGALEPLGADFTLDTLGVRQLPSLAVVQSGIQQLTQNPNWFATLGNTQLNIRNRIATFPLVLEAGLSNRLSIGIQVPYVVTQTSAFFNVNTTMTEGNLGFNPALTNTSAQNVNATFLAQFTAAANSLQSSLDACAANPGSSPNCPALNANRANALALINNSNRFAGGAAGPTGLYTTSPFVPIVGTDAQLSIEARVAAFRALYQQFGVNSIGATTTGPFAAQNRLTVLDAQKILTDPSFGIGADSLTSTRHSHFGDIDLGAKFSVFDSFGNTAARMSPHGLNFRTAIGGIFRLPTSQIESPDNFIDVGTGRHAKAVEGRWFGDLGIGSHFWQSFVVRFNKPFADDQVMRILDLPNEELAPTFRRQTVHRQLGTTFEFETTPRFVVNDFFSLSAQYVYRHKAEDRYTGTFTIPAAVTGYSDVALDASTLDLETETKEHRVGGGLAYSNLYAFQQGKAKMPFEVTYLHWQTVKGWGGNQPKYFTDQIQLRLYARMFGGK
ncbi:MAG: hypothetical protein ABI408_03045 [Gemmatimonadaceae bacterium]